MKVCTKCKRELEERAFPTDNSKRDGLHSHCRDCTKDRKARYCRRPEIKLKTREYHDRYLQNHPEYRKNKVHKRTKRLVKRDRENKIRAVEYLGNKCSRCGRSFECLAVYEFHHTEVLLKGKDISRLRGVKWEKIKAELDNGCVLLCANCHREIHDEMFPKS